MKQIFHKQRLVADILAMIIFSTITGVIIEIGIIGLSWKQSFASRLAAIPINLLTGHPQGWWIDYLRTLFASQKGWRKWFVDMLGFVTMQTLVFCTSVTIGMVCSSNFSWGTLWKSAYTIIPLLPFLGLVYGWWQDTVRTAIHSFTNKKTKSGIQNTSYSSSLSISLLRKK